MLVYPKIARVAVSFRTIFIILCGWDGKLWSSHADFSETGITHTLIRTQHKHKRTIVQSQAEKFPAAMTSQVVNTR